MSENTNELSVNLTTVVSETENYVVVKDENGKFTRKAKYADYSSIEPKDKAEKIWLLNLFEAAEDSGFGLKDYAGHHIEIADIITRKYDKINEETGQQEYGVLTYLVTPDRIVYVTSSKNVYFSIMHIMELFGKPTDPDWENITVQVGKKKGTNGDMVTIKMIG